jgi:hypothetical protein
MVAKSNLLVVVCSLFVSLAFARSAYAEDSWTETVSFRRGDAAAIKVFEPDGYTASVTVDGAAQSDQVPTVLRVPNADSFVLVTITATNGSKWSKKIETKKGSVTELRVKHTAAAAAAPGAKPGRKYFGKFAMSTKMPCDTADGGKIKIEFVTPEGVAAASFIMSMNKPFTGEVPDGDYQVRTFRVETDGTFTYRNTRNGAVHNDGWSALLFCNPKGGGADIQVSAK